MNFFQSSVCDLQEFSRKRTLSEADLSSPEPPRKRRRTDSTILAPLVAPVAPQARQTRTLRMKAMVEAMSAQGVDVCAELVQEIKSYVYPSVELNTHYIQQDDSMVPFVKWHDPVETEEDRTYFLALRVSNKGGPKLYGRMLDSVYTIWNEASDPETFYATERISDMHAEFVDFCYFVNELVPTEDSYYVSEDDDDEDEVIDVDKDIYEWGQEVLEFFKRTTLLPEYPVSEDPVLI